MGICWVLVTVVADVEDVCRDGIFSVWAVHWTMSGMVVFLVCVVLVSPPNVGSLLLLVKDSFPQSRLGV
jgi:hypothetical protein